MMPWWGYVIMCVCTAIILPAWWNIRGRMITVEKDIVALKKRQDAKDEQCNDRLEWLRGMDGKLDKVGEDLAEIKGYVRGRDTDRPPKIGT